MQDAPAGETYRLVYRSRSRIPVPERRAVLGELFSTARSNNRRSGITGALLVTDECFVQALEGDERAVRRLLEIITADPRHDAVTVLDARVVPGRVFSRWAMARVADDGEHDIPLIAHPDGIAAVTPRRDATPEQLHVLDDLRAATRDPASGTLVP